MKNFNMLFLTMLIISNVVNIGCYPQIPLDDMTKVASYIENKLTSLVKSVTKYDEIETVYKNLIKENSVTIHAVNVSQVGIQYNENLGTLLQSFVKSARNIKNKAEIFYEEHIYQESAELQQYFHEESEMLPTHMEKWAQKFSCYRKVNFNHSYIHTPINVYKYHKDVVNDVAWSNKMDDIFVKNYKENPDLLWQFYGSETGMRRLYPGMKLYSDEHAYDCRRQVWYTEAITSPKNVVVVLDLSGSMTGKHFAIAKLIIRALVDSFQENDFFNIVLFNESVRLVIPCIVNLMQATLEYKNLVINAIDRLPEPNGSSKPSKGLEKAFEVLATNYENNSTSSACTQMVILISDGIENDEEIDTVLKVKNADKKVAIFSYITARANQNVMKRIACDNGGEFYEFPTLGSVWDSVMRYQQILSHPKALANENHVTFTHLYKDSNETELMFTVCIGVSSKGTNTTEGTLLGVAGVNIRQILLERKVPSKKIGFFGNAFAINNNGIILTHPVVKTIAKKYLGPIISYLDEVEYMTNQSDAGRLRKDMVDQNTGCFHSVVDALFSGAKRLARLNVTYCYEPIQETPFTSGVRIATRDQQRLTVFTLADEQLLSGISALTSVHNNVAIEIGNLMFCNNALQGESTEFPNASRLKLYLDNVTDNSTMQRSFNDCDVNMLHELLLSAHVLTKIHEESNTNMMSNAVKSLSITMVSGYLFSIHYGGESTKIHDRNIWSNDAYLHALSFDDLNTLVVSVGTLTQEEKRKYTQLSEKFVSLRRVMHVQNVTLGVASVNITIDYMRYLLNNASSRFDALNCTSTDSYQCFLIDENAYIVVSNQGNEDVGTFFSHVNGVLMKQFLHCGFFEQNKFLSPICDTGEIWHTSNISSHSVPLVNTYQWLNTIIRAGISHFYWFLYILCFKPVIPAVYHQEHVSYRGCRQYTIIYKRTVTQISQSGVIACAHNCNETFSIQTVNGTNLLLIITTNNCQNRCMRPMQLGKVIEAHDHNKCPLASPNYRRPLSVCHKLEGDHAECPASKYDIPRMNQKLYLVSLLVALFAVLLSVGVYPVIKGQIVRLSADRKS